MHDISSIRSLQRVEIGDTVLDYRLDPASGLVGMRLYPAALTESLAVRRTWLADFEQERAALGSRQRAALVDSLVQAKCVGDDYPTGFSQGLSLRNSETTLGLKYERQERHFADGRHTLTTFLQDAAGREARHHVAWREGESVLEIYTEFYNGSALPVGLELLTSFSLGDLTPFDSADAPGRLRVYRLRSAWSAEGRLDVRSVEELNLERSWQDHAVRCERFGQVGSLPVRGFFPFAAVEDKVAGVCWGAQLAWAGSWQMEFYRQGDALCLSGGLADREFGHWLKTLAPGETLRTPVATVACVQGDLETLCGRLTEAQHHAADTHPAIEADLPIIANEFCTSWGDPLHENIEALARRLEGTPVRYLVIDAGWYGDPGSAWWNGQGEWRASARRFPQGLAATAAMIRRHGLIPGLWFEMEVTGSGSATFDLAAHQLKRDGLPVTTTKRHFWDFRDPWVRNYLSERVIGTLREGGFGYAKFDYNETIGIGVDGAESLGEGLRQQIEAVTAFYDRIRAELPDLVIECCSSGGHRLEPSMIGRSAMSSFSDAHESREIPLLAANLHRALLPRQSQIWAVLRNDDDRQRLLYSLAATFLGRMCLSGDLPTLSAEAWRLVEEAMAFYGRVAPIIKHGHSRRFGADERGSYRHPTGWQAVRRIATAGDRMLVVAHTFGASDRRELTVPLPHPGWRIVEKLHSEGAAFVLEKDRLNLRLTADFDAAVVLLAG